MNIAYVIRYYWTFIKVFILAKLFFLLINSNGFFKEIKAFPRIWWEGLKLDISMISYLIVFPLLLLIFVKYSERISKKITDIYHIVVFSILTLVFAADPFFYKYWGNKANLFFVQFLDEGRAGISSVAWTDYLSASAFFTIMLFLFLRHWRNRLLIPQNSKWGYILICLALAFVGIRGGLSIVPLNVSSAFYSDNNLHNNTAVNAVWNLVSNELEREQNKPVHFMDDEIALNLFEEIPVYDRELKNVISFNDSTNVMIIILESFTAKVSALLSGNHNVTPNLDALMREGIYFSNAYAASFRSDRGLTSILTGMPSLARQTLTNMPNKMDRQANLFKLFNQSGYNTSFFHGGDIAFANLKVIVKDAKNMRDINAFTSDLRNDWGIHDEVMFSEYRKYLKGVKSPFFTCFFSLSSHEPFNVPSYEKFSDKYLNSIAYTDSCLAEFIRNFKQDSCWKNTLLIITADHGTTRPNRAATFEAENFRIPLLLAGGAVLKDTCISTVVSQSDICYTLAGLLGREKEVKLGNSLLQPSGIAFYTYYNGIACVRDSCRQIFDIDHQKYLKDTCSLPYEKAYYQLANRYFYRN